MILAAIVFVVLMILWLVWDLGIGERKPYPNTLIPWACVAILGYAVFRGVL